MNVRSLLSTVLAVAVATVRVSTQSPSSTTPVPSGTPIPGNYSGDLRPQIHFSPPTNFMNDPNGMFIDSEGTWHLYYQRKSSEPVLHVSRHVISDYYQTTRSNPLQAMFIGDMLRAKIYTNGSINRSPSFPATPARASSLAPR